MWHLGYGSVDVVVSGQRLDLMMLEVFSNLSDSMVLYFFTASALPQGLVPGERTQNTPGDIPGVFCKGVVSPALGPGAPPLDGGQHRAPPVSSVELKGHQLGTGALWGHHRLLVMCGHV